MADRSELLSSSQVQALEAFLSDDFHLRAWPSLRPAAASIPACEGGFRGADTASGKALVEAFQAYRDTFERSLQDTVAGLVGPSPTPHFTTAERLDACVRAVERHAGLIRSSEEQLLVQAFAPALMLFAIDSCLVGFSLRAFAETAPDRGQRRTAEELARVLCEVGHDAFVSLNGMLNMLAAEQGRETRRKGPSLRVVGADRDPAVAEQDTRWDAESLTDLAAAIQLGAARASHILDLLEGKP